MKIELIYPVFSFERKIIEVDEETFLDTKEMDSEEKAQFIFKNLSNEEKETTNQFFITGAISADYIAGIKEVKTEN